MNGDFKVSVIVPVYNAANFIQDAVLSALKQPQTGEVILIEDGSKDNSLTICKELEYKYEKVFLYQHENGGNKGASVSRNLGIHKAKFEFISFLDADDLYCENRFEFSQKYLLADLNIDGVYDGAQYYNEKKKYGFKRSVSSKNLLFYLLKGTYGHFHTNAITIRRRVFDKVGYFNPELRLHQDAEMWLRLAHSCVLVPGNLNKSVAFIRRHEGNRIWTGTTYQTRLNAYLAFDCWRKNKHTKRLDIIVLKRKISILKSKINNTHWLKEFFLCLFH